MKREHVVPDLLASMTADALFSEKPPQDPTKPALGKLSARLWRWRRGAQKQTTAGAALPVKFAAPADRAHGRPPLGVETDDVAKDGS
jgi:hypothetical protein